MPIIPTLIVIPTDASHMAVCPFCEVPVTARIDGYGTLRRERGCFHIVEMSSIERKVSVSFCED